ncbi:MAG: glycine cleavage T C-terminal barrel domain-containing protein, partial [Gemmataceae bacterium]
EPIIMSRDRAGHVNRALMQLALSEPVPPGTPLLRDGAEIGTLTSISTEQTVAGFRALGYVRRNHQEPGLTIHAGPTATAVIVAGLPTS